MILEFTGKNVLVTGGSCGIGICLAPLLIHSGLHPCLVVRSEKKKKLLEKTLTAYTDRFSIALIDFSTPMAVRDYMKSTKICFDYLVDLYQSDYESMVAAADPAMVSDYFTDNIGSRAELIRGLSRQMLKKKFGRMIFISSAAAEYPAEGQGFYAASKLAAEGLYKNTGLELGPRGITTFTIRPGYIDSGRGTRFLEKRQVRHVMDKKKLCETILFFMSASADGFNAGHVVMDGGLTSGKQSFKRKNQDGYF